MKKQDKLNRANEKQRNIEKWKAEENAMEHFFQVSKPFLSEENWKDFYEDMWQEGKWTYGFNSVILSLAEDQIKVTPEIRKAIDSCIEIFEIEREKIKHLSRLNYDSYWKNYYGY